MLNQSVIDWLLVNANSAMFQLYHGENKLIFNEMMMRSALFKTNMLSWILIVLAHWNNSPRVDMSLHSDALSWFRVNQSLIFLLNTACLADYQQIPISLSLVWPVRGSKPRFTTLEASTLTSTPPMRFLNNRAQCISQSVSCDLLVIEKQPYFVLFHIHYWNVWHYLYIAT